MEIKERVAALEEIWRVKIKDNKDTLYSWSKHPKSFISWSLAKYHPGTALSVINPKRPELMLPYNLCYRKKDDKFFVEPEVQKNQKNQKKGLTESDVEEIRNLLEENVKQKKIAGMYGVTPAAISDIARGKTWRRK